MLIESPTRHRGDFGPIWRRSPWRIWFGVTVTGVLVVGFMVAVSIGLE